MKIEKVNDNQIRCTLTREDLAERQIKLSELAYGTEKAKMLFRDMMQQAAYEFGFEADDIPLMIEALPQWFDFAGDVLQQKPKSFEPTATPSPGSAPAGCARHG